jgi:ABC-type transport system involved in multi-copper enzyme maturation permease subunit
MPTPTDALLRYRPWRGTFRGPLNGSLAMARVSLRLMARRKLFWALYALAALIFFFFFYAQYLVVWLQLQAANQTVAVAGMRIPVTDLFKFFDRLALNGSAHTFGNFIWFEGYVAMIVLSLAGAVLVGNDFHHGSLPFYLAKPIGRWHYVLGKCLGAGLFVNLLTTVPAVLLYIQAGLLYDWQAYYLDHWRELLGVLAYGAVLTATLSLLLVATAVWLRRTVPLVMVWAGVFVLGRMLAAFLVDGQHFDVRWRLIDLWNDLYLVGLWCLGADRTDMRPSGQPAVWEAAAVVGLVCAACLLYLRRRVQAVEIVS